jgi:hypothetical protein
MHWRRPVMGGSSAIPPEAPAQLLQCYKGQCDPLRPWLPWAWPVPLPSGAGHHGSPTYWHLQEVRGQGKFNPPPLSPHAPYSALWLVFGQSEWLGRQLANAKSSLLWQCCTTTKDAENTCSPASTMTTWCVLLERAQSLTKNSTLPLHKTSSQHH